MTDLDESQKDLYEINNYYQLFTSCFFKCISKPLLSDKYDISFIFEPDYIEKENPNKSL